MKCYNYEGKSKEEAISKAEKELNISRDEMLIQITEEKSGIVKKVTRIKVISTTELINFIKEKLIEITKLMNININLEIRRREEVISIKMFSDNNNILIGKNGKTIQAMQTIIKQIVYNELETGVSILLDVEDYKEKRIKNIEYLAKKTAREVSQSKVEVKLDSMNSYERRIVHEILSNNRYVYTISEGAEPNRYVIIKPKEA